MVQGDGMRKRHKDAILFDNLVAECEEALMKRRIPLKQFLRVLGNKGDYLEYIESRGKRVEPSLVEIPP